jgi:hypothetical protein
LLRGVAIPRINKNDNVFCRKINENNILTVYL